MLFNSIQFVYFLPIVIILYYVIPFKFRWIFLLLASYYFYMCWKVEYIVLILASTLVDYIAGLRMGRLNSRKKRTPWLILSLFTNLGLLFTFKYYNFFSSSLNDFFENYNLAYHLPLFDILLPVGISFYTFQTLSYSIEVYLGNQKAEKHLGYFALYVAYFPQLVAGPIERFSRLAPQLKKEHKLKYQNIVNGLRLILYGLFIKMVIADNLSFYVDQVYGSINDYNSFDILTAVFFYSFQIYCDFHGYSTIAIGSAMLMGIRIMDNFKTPYMARNIAEFWQRWHISLSTWFRDYLYYPLGGNRVKLLRWIFNIMIVFTVSGLWHGANWTFVFWGGLFGIIYLLEKGIEKIVPLPNSSAAFSIIHILLSLKTFLIVTFIWIFFRSQTITDAFDVFSNLFSNYYISNLELGVNLKTWLILGFFILTDILMFNTRFDLWVGRFHIFLRWIIYATLIFMLVVYSAVEHFPFIYFQF